MGDRSNIVIAGELGGSDIYLYGHWMGTGSIDAALVGCKSGRTDDGAYLARIVFQTMLGNDQGETGFGVATNAPDNEYPILVLDPNDRTVHIQGSPKTRVPMSKFVELAEGVLADATVNEYERLDALAARMQDFTITLIEKAGPKLPTEPGWYGSTHYPLSKGCEPYVLDQFGVWKLGGVDTMPEYHMISVGTLTKLGSVTETAAEVIQYMENLYWNATPTRKLFEHAREHFGATDA